MANSSKQEGLFLSVVFCCVVFWVVVSFLSNLWDYNFHIFTSRNYSMQRIARNLFAHSVLTVCPNVNPTYERGTFSIALVGPYLYYISTFWYKSVLMIFFFFQDFMTLMLPPLLSPLVKSAILLPPLKKGSNVMIFQMMYFFFFPFLFLFLFLSLLLLILL